MKLDWNRDSGKWQIFDDDNPQRIALVREVHLMVPASMVSVDGGRHGYLIADGHLTISNDIATIRRHSDG